MFAKLTKRRLQRGVFPSVVALQEAINHFVAAHNRDPKPFVWKADPKAIIAAAKRGYQVLIRSTSEVRGHVRQLSTIEQWETAVDGTRVATWRIVVQTRALNCR